MSPATAPIWAYLSCFALGFVAGAVAAIAYFRPVLQAAIKMYNDEKQAAALERMNSTMQAFRRSRNAKGGTA